MSLQSRSGDGDLVLRTVVNVLLTEEWRRVRAQIVAALAPYPDARLAVAVLAC